jgi:precorrin-6A/cobalt-precorrin-6A reductase
MATGAKLLAARDLGIEVVMIARPSSPPGPTVTTAAAALDWVERTGAAAQPAGSGG